MLEALDINVAFGNKTILDSVSLSMAPGESIALLGSSGSGKTTFLRVLAGILCPSSGSVSCDGVQRVFNREQNWNGWVWPQVTLVFQDIRLFPTLSGLANCVVGAGQTALKSAHVLARQLGVEHCLDRRPHQMSQGEQQRVAIVRALLRGPEYLLMDEPTSALDSSLQERVAEVIRGLPHGTSVLIATHDLAFAASVVTSYLAIRDGKLFRAKTLHEGVDLITSGGKGNVPSRMP